MIDRIEELLSEMTAEEDEEQEEDVLVQKRGAVVSSGPSSERSERGETPEGRTAFAESDGLGRAANRRGVTAETRESEDRSGGRTAEEIALEPPGLTAGKTGDVGTGDRSGGRTAGEIASERPGLTAGEAAEARAQAAGVLWKDGPVWTVRSVEPEIDRVQRAAAEERTARAEETFQPSRDGDPVWSGPEWAALSGGRLGPPLDGTGRAGLEQAGLKGLYRQSVQGLRPAAPALPPGQAGRTARAQEPGSAASLAVDELDRAVRRDSRRYDGGMSIY